MKVNDIKELSLPELEKSIRDTRDQLLELKLRKQTGQVENTACLLYTSPSPRDRQKSRMPSSA